MPHFGHFLGLEILTGPNATPLAYTSTANDTIAMNNAINRAENFTR